MKKTELMEAVRVVVGAAAEKPSPSYAELKSLNKLKTWLREQDEIASTGSRGRVVFGKPNGGTNG